MSGYTSTMEEFATKFNTLQDNIDTHEAKEILKASFLEHDYANKYISRLSKHQVYVSIGSRGWDGPKCFEIIASLTSRYKAVCIPLNSEAILEVLAYMEKTLTKLGSRGKKRDKKKDFLKLGEHGELKRKAKALDPDLNIRYDKNTKRYTICFNEGINDSVMYQLKTEHVSNLKRFLDNPEPLFEYVAQFKSVKSLPYYMPGWVQVGNISEWK
jgi:hypothetical protein